MTVRGCTFCGIVDGSIAASIVYRDGGAVAFLDTRPVFKGHVLIVPTAHVVTLPDLPAEALVPYFTAVQRIAGALPSALGADGTFVAQNNVISQSVPHLHFHIVPRTKGDGLRGFFWPRVRYTDDAERESYAARIAAALK
jgi:histidine triad (HIT) family protein